MKIIDKHKDYYDYLQGIWGQDPKAIYVRNNVKVFSPEDYPSFLEKKLPDGIDAYQGEIILTCGLKEHHIYVENFGNGPFLEEFLCVNVQRAKDSAPLVLEWYVNEWKTIRSKWSPAPRPMDSYCAWAKILSQSFNNRKKNRSGRLLPIFELRSEPIKARWENPILASLPFTFVPAEEVFSGIYDFLLASHDTDIPDNRTDIEKLEAAGFDRKTSFRNIK